MTDLTPLHVERTNLTPLRGAGVSNFLIPKGIIPYCVQSYEIIPTYR